MALFMAATTFGPLIGPVASGFIAVVSWRWTFWLGLIIAGVTWIPLLAMPETYGPVILKRRAKRLRKESGDDDVFAPIELEPQDVRHVVTVVLTRPIRMMLFEWIVLFSCLYLSFVYAVFYMFFQAYPIMYRGGCCFSFIPQSSLSLYLSPFHTSRQQDGTQKKYLHFRRYIRLQRRRRRPRLPPQ